MKTVDLYVRVSTDEQADKGYSQRNQEEVLRRYCDINFFSVRKVIYEDHSAKTFIRPQWVKYLAEIKRSKGKADLLLFTKWDRFSRNAGDAYQMISTLKCIGIEPQAIEQPLDLSIPENKMMLAFYLAAPEVENDRRALNVIYGMRRAKKEGRWMSTAPFGYVNKTNENGQKYICIKEPEASSMRWAFEEIERGIVFPDQVRKELNRRGVKCSSSNFWRLLRNPVYCGKIHIPKYKDEESITVNGLHDGIISESLFYKVQDVLDGKKRNVKSPVQIDTNPEFPLRGFLICPECSRSLTASFSKGRNQYYSYYHCNLGCTCRFKTDSVHDSFSKELKKHLPHSAVTGLYELLLLNLHETYGKQQQTGSRQILNEIKKQNDRLSNARELLLNGDIEADDFKIMKTEAEKKILQLETDLAETKSNFSTADNLDQLMKKAVTASVQLDTLYHDGDTRQKREVVGSIYPEKLCFDGFGYRTARVNEAVRLICSVDKGFGEIKNGKGSKNLHLSRMVAGTGIEPVFAP